MSLIYMIYKSSSYKNVPLPLEHIVRDYVLIIIISLLNQQCVLYIVNAQSLFCCFVFIVLLGYYSVKNNFEMR